MNTKKFMLTYFITMLVFSYFLLFIKRFCLVYIYTWFSYKLMFLSEIIIAVTMLVLSLLPHIFGMWLAYKNILIKAWANIILYWTVSSIICGIIPYAGVIFVPQYLAWRLLVDIIYISAYSVYVTPFLCAVTHTITSLLFLYILWRINKNRKRSYNNCLKSNY